MGLNYPIIPQTRFSGRRDKTATPRERRASLARLDLGRHRDPGVDGGGWLWMRDGRSKTAPIINHRMIHSIVPSPSVRSSSKPDPGEKARAFSKEITSAAGRELASSLRRRQSITLGTPARPPPIHLTPVLSLFISRMPDPPSPSPQTIPHIHLYSWTSHRFHPRPFVLPLHDVAADSADLARGKLYFSTTFFPRHCAAPLRIDPLPCTLHLLHGLSIFEKL